MNDVLFLLNPTANEGKAGSQWKKMMQQYPSLPENPHDITKIKNLSQLIKDTNPTVIAIAGGDGTINTVCEVVQTLKKKPDLTILPLGFGNALSYCFGVETMDKAVEVLQKRQRTVEIDLLKTSLPKNPYGVFNISVGFDARIVHNRMNYRYIGLRSYAISLLRSMFTHPESKITLTIDKTVSVEARASSLVIANCPIIGLNYVVAPQAKMNDGQLDCTLFSTKYAYLTNFRLRGFKHPLYSELGKVHFKASHVRIEGEPFIQVDGDPVMEKTGFEIEILPKQVTFLRNKQENIDQYYQPFFL